MEDYPGTWELADEIMFSLSGLVDEAQRKIELGKYGYQQAPIGDDCFIVEKGARKYFIRKEYIIEGDISTIHEGYCVENGEAVSVIAKIIGQSKDVRLIRNGIKNLNILFGNPGPQAKHFPVIMDQFDLAQGRTMVIMRKFNGYDIEYIRETERYQDGIPQEHVAWILSRLLSALGRAHDQNVVNCSIMPSHVMIRPKDHNLMLLGWSYSTYDPFRAEDRSQASYESFSAPEVREGKIAGSQSDLYMVGKLAIYMLGGDVSAGKIPQHVDPRLQRFIEFLLLESPIQRARDAWEMQQDLERIRTSIWGPRTDDSFMKFEM